MAQTSIRDFAQQIGTSHPTVSAAIKAIEDETGQELGIKQGKGKSTLLSDADQAILTMYFHGEQTDASFSESSESPSSEQKNRLNTQTTSFGEFTHFADGHGSQMTIIASTPLDIDVMDGKVIQLALTDTTQAVEQVQGKITLSTDHYLGNRTLLSSGIVRQAQEEGRTLAAQVGAIRWGTFIKTSEQIDLEQAKRLGLLASSPDTNEQTPQAS